MTNPGQNFSVTTAADACQVSRKTITRRLDQLKEGGAYKDGAGSWVIPLAALLHAGLKPGRPAAPDPVPVSQGTDVGQVGADVGQQDTVSQREADLLRRAEVAEALAAERAGQIADLRLALRMLGPGTSTTETPAPAPAPVAPQHVPASAPRRQGGFFERTAARFGL